MSASACTRSCLVIVLSSVGDLMTTLAMTVSAVKTLFLYKHYKINVARIAKCNNCMKYLVNLGAVWLAVDY